MSYNVVIKKNKFRISLISATYRKIYKNKRKTQLIKRKIEETYYQIKC